jgi:protein-disulfide isomerase
VERWNEARGSETVETKLAAAQDCARDEGIEGTPTLVISGPEGTREVVGAVPIDRVSEAIEKVGRS